MARLKVHWKCLKAEMTRLNVHKKERLETRLKEQLKDCLETEMSSLKIHLKKCFEKGMTSYTMVHL